MVKTHNSRFISSLKYSIFVKETRDLTTIENKRNLDTKWHLLRNGQNEHTCTIILQWPGKLFCWACRSRLQHHAIIIYVKQTFLFLECSRQYLRYGHIGSSTNRKITLYVGAFDKASSIPPDLWCFPLHPLPSRPWIILLLRFHLTSAAANIRHPLEALNW